MCALSKLLEVGSIQKDKTNEFNGYAYTSEAAVTSSFREKMLEAGLHIAATEIVSHELGEIQGRNGVLSFTTVKLRITIADDNGPVGTYEAIGQGADVGDKSAAKAMAQAKKYCLSMAGLISWGDDDPEADVKTDIATQKRPQSPPTSNGQSKSTGTPSDPVFVPDKPDQADLFMSLLKEKSRVGMEALQRAWQFETHEADVAKACRKWAASVDDGKWWAKVKAKADAMDAKNKAPEVSMNTERMPTVWEIGASQMPAVCGTSPFLSRPRLWRQLTFGETIETNAYMERGQRLEPLVVAAVEAELGCVFNATGDAQQSGKITHGDLMIRATPDGVLGREGLECKIRESISVEPPMKSLPQLVAQMLVWNLSSVLYAELGHELRIWRVYRSAELEAVVLGALFVFCQFLRSGTEPPRWSSRKAPRPKLTVPLWERLC